MKFLLDTHLLLWASGSPERLSSVARELIEEPSHELFFSPASIWEIVIKNNLGRQDFQVDVHVLRRGLVDNNYYELAITSEHVVAIDCLPAIHKDPFDRILIAQATIEGITLLTADVVVAQYPGSIRRV